MARPGETRRKLLEFALGLPGAWLDHPWGEDVTKVGKKVFVFFGMSDDERLAFTVKLPHSGDEALAMEWSSVPGYGLDRGGWVTVKPPEDAPVELLTAWIEESYRTVAPKGLVRLLDQGAERSSP